MPGVPSILPLALGAIAALGCLIGAFWSLRRKRLIDDLPTSKAQGVFIGMTELKGTAESESPLTSYLANARCVQYAWQADEQWRRVVTTTSTDAKGHVHVHTHVETGWTRVAGDIQSIPFYLKDDTGVIRIAPDGAAITGTTTFNQTVTPGDPLYFSKAPRGEIANTTHHRRFRETALPLHTMLYIMGQAREREDIVAPEIARDKDAQMFLISTRTEKQISSSYGRWYWFWTILGLLAAMAGAGFGGVVSSPYSNSTFSWGMALFGGGGFLIALGIGWLWTVYNSLINLHHRVEQGWSQVDVQLKRRHDLIPNLVTTVQGYRDYENETQKALAALRAEAESAATQAHGVAPLLRAVAERYPDLKASDSFLKLQQSLVDTEQRIALARDYYNDIATFYNTRLAIIPDRYAATLAGLKTRTLMEAADFERAPVKVDLAS